MNETSNIKKQLEPRLQKMLLAYGSAARTRDPRVASRNRAMFMAEVDMLFEQRAVRPAVTKVAGETMVPSLIRSLLGILNPGTDTLPFELS